jgi:DNA-binding FadR family transcriptional regulator
MELWEAMMAIEPAAAQYAASRRSPVQLRRLTRASVLFKEGVGDTAAAVGAVVDFFTAVAEASGNRVLALSQAPLNLLLEPALSAIIDRVPQARARIEAAQAKIIDAIRLNKSEQARTWMEKHIRDFKRGYELDL